MPEAMISPGELLQGDSLDGFVAPSTEMDHGEVQCGVGRLSSRCCQRFATNKCFMGLLIAITLLQGSAQGYLSATVPVIAQRFGLPVSFVDWVMIGHEVMQGAFALGIAFFGGRSCRPSWIAACVIIQAVCQFSVAVPLIAYGATGANTTSQKHDWLCADSEPRFSDPDLTSTSWFTMVVLVIAQVGAGIGLSSFTAHGLTYLDDNSEKLDSPSLLGAVLCATQLGPKLGQLLAYWCSALSGATSGNMVSGKELNGAWWLGWPVLSTSMIVTASFAAMFPKRLPSMAVKEAAASILDLARSRVSIVPEQNRVHISEEREYILDPPSPGFCATVKRLFANQMILANILAAVCMHMALSNFSNYEDRYLESVYFIPKPQYAGGVFQDQWISRVTTGFLKPPIVAMAVLLSGLIISRSQPRPRVLALWNIIIALTSALIFLIYIALECPLLKVRGSQEESLKLIETCNSGCHCPINTPFQPVCDRDGIYTFYSPCHAGCSSVHILDDIKLYDQCSCISYGHMAKSGPCSSQDCTGKWVLFQSLRVLMAGLLGTGIVGNLLICLRCVLPQDKPALLGLELLLVGKMMVPSKFIYKLLVDSTCKYWGGDTYTCQLFQSDKLIANINILTACLLLMSSFFDLFVWYFCRDLKLYSDEDSLGAIEDIELDDVQRMKISKRLATPAVRRRKRDARNGGAVSQIKEEHEGPEEQEELLNAGPSGSQGVRIINATLV